ncbi:anti-sigma factor domain-containing protein [Streptomyces sp. MK37H]|uniref:anti-sigma factor n=1 Tax=Streptomyces sp. MK37H TaxID=2699117 RepID=UPI001B37C404|nr:anti-sigma factor [Streptomyces sp. MK37H]MBP8537064.1 anti-sigma factor [Streptomyces sp. MK37H]
MTRADLHTLTGAYAVNALSGRELSEFERHLAVCDACRQEVRELRETAAKLAVATALAPPPTMKDDVLRRIATVRQEPPRVAAREPRESHAGPRRRTGRRAMNFALAACVAAAAVCGGAAVWQYRQASDARDTARRSEQRVAQAEEMTQVLAAPDAHSRSGRMADGSTGTVVVSRGLNKAVFLASGLPEPPAGRIYQLWFSDGGTMRPAGLMDSSGRSTAAVMSGAVGKASAMGVTVEPAGGSKTPTSDPLVLLTFPSA